MEIESKQQILERRKEIEKESIVGISGKSKQFPEVEMVRFLPEELFQP